MDVHDLKSLRETLAGGQHTGEELNRALMEACFWGQLDAARALLEAGADANTVRAEDEEDEYLSACTALLLAISMARDEDESVILEWLGAFVEHGADLNLAPDGSTVLMRACEQRWGKVVGYLLEHGADPSAVSLPMGMLHVAKEDLLLVLDGDPCLTTFRIEDGKLTDKRKLEGIGFGRGIFAGSDGAWLVLETDDEKAETHLVQLELSRKGASPGRRLNLGKLDGPIRSVWVHAGIVHALCGNGKLIRVGA